MRIGGVVAEYNPFHNGHAYQLMELRQAGATHIAVVMSGNFVQWGNRPSWINGPGQRQPSSVGRI